MYSEGCEGHLGWSQGVLQECDVILNATRLWSEGLLCTLHWGPCTCAPRTLHTPAVAASNCSLCRSRLDAVKAVSGSLGTLKSSPTICRALRGPDFCLIPEGLKAITVWFPPNKRVHPRWYQHVIAVIVGYKMSGDWKALHAGFSQGVPSSGPLRPSSGPAGIVRIV